MKNTEKPKKAPKELSISYIVEKWRADAREVEIRTRVAKELIKSGIAPAFHTTPGNNTPTTDILPPAKFTGNKLIDIYDPKAIYKEFKKELKCDYSTFKAWFVDSVIYDKKMYWTFENGNKAQLMRFLFVLCAGWEPKEINTAFKISVDSNNNRAKELNSKLLQRIEKCKI